MTARSLGRLAAVLLVAGVPVAGAVSDAERERELEAVRREIEQRRERLEAFERRERGLLETLEEMDRAAARLSADGARARSRAGAARRDLVEAEDLAAALAERRERTRAAMSLRAVALYKAGEAGPVAAVFSAGSLQEMLARSRVLRLLLEHDLSLMRRFEADGRDLEQTRARAGEAARENEHALRLAFAQGRELAEQRRAKRALAADVREDRTTERAALQELEAAAVALEETLARLHGQARTEPAAIPPSVDFAALQGQLPPPVEAPVARGFGRVVDAEFRTEVFRKGVDFAAEAGVPVRAVAPGEVRFAGWFRGYGRIVILDHGGGYFTVSGHLDELRVDVGEGVEEGGILGTVGETGSLSGPRLYFEIREGAEPRDPARWLLLDR